MAEGSAAGSFVSSVDSDRESSEEDVTEYFSLVRPYQDEPLAGEEGEVAEAELDADGLSLGVLWDRFEDTVSVDSW